MKCSKANDQSTESQDQDSFANDHHSSERKDDKSDNKLRDNDPIKKTGKFDEGKCAICLVSPQVDKSFPPCEHTFCYECLDRWCNVKDDCPTCKLNIPIFHHKDGKKVRYIQEERIKLRQEAWIQVEKYLRGEYSEKNCELILRLIYRRQRARLLNRRRRFSGYVRNSERVENRIKVLNSEISDLRKAINGQMEVEYDVTILGPKNYQVTIYDI